MGVPIVARADCAGVTIIGRSSSHFTRVLRMFAAELQVEYRFQTVADLQARDPGSYGGNPALTVPSLHTSEGAWFGSLSACRQLARLASEKPAIVWPEHLVVARLANAQELVLQAMATDVTLLMSTHGTGPDGTDYLDKLRQSLDNTLAWLEDNARQIFWALPESRDISYLEVTLFCLLTHLEFRNVRSIDGYVQLNEFTERFGRRRSARLTRYRFDQSPGSVARGDGKRMD